jgi:hypothetical protein
LARRSLGSHTNANIHFALNATLERGRGAETGANSRTILGKIPDDANGPAVANRALQVLVACSGHAKDRVLGALVGAFAGFWLVGGTGGGL